MDIRKRFGKKLREIRLRKGLSQETLAEECNLHRTYVSSVERGKRNISLVNIEKVSRALGVKIADLFQ